MGFPRHICPDDTFYLLRLPVLAQDRQRRGPAGPGGAVRVCRIGDRTAGGGLRTVGKA